LDFGGPVTKVQLLAAELTNLGVDVEILTADFGPRRTRVPPGSRDVQGIPVTYLRRLLSRGWLSIAPGAGRFIRQRRFDVVHCFGLRDGLVTSASFAAGRAGIPVVLEPMGMAVPRIRSLGLKRFADRGTRVLLRPPAITIATSELEGKELRSLGYPNVEVRYNPVTLSHSRRDVPNAYDLCYIGRLHRKKQLFVLTQILLQRPGLRAIVAGSDEDGTGDQLALEATRLGVADRLTLRGWIDESERDEVLASSTCFVLPSLTENFGNAAAEALQAGVPVVVTDQCGIAELVRDTRAGVVTSVVPDEIVRETLRFIDDPELIRKCSDAAPEAVAQLHPRTIAERQLEIYEQVTNGV
jgi:glycosyltransferase involved in cell wall biosynthesis